MTETYTLEEFDVDCLSAPSCDQEGNVMVFQTFDDAAGMARFIVEDPTSFPLVAILAHEIVDGEQTGWSAGWAIRAIDGTVGTHEGDYESEPDWGSLRARAGEPIVRPGKLGGGDWGWDIVVGGEKVAHRGTESEALAYAAGWLAHAER